MQKTPARTYEQQEAQFFRQRGYTTAGIAGALGNLEKESSWEPTAYNPNEGAIGIAQWENNRRTNLDNVARQMGTNEANINAQLAYMSDELGGSFSSVDQYMKTATDPRAAANEWNRHYEISGDYSQDRENNASAIYQRLANGAPLTGGGNSSSEFVAAPVPSGGSGEPPSVTNSKGYLDIQYFKKNAPYPSSDKGIKYPISDSEWSKFQKYFDSAPSKEWSITRAPGSAVSFLGPIGKYTYTIQQQGQAPIVAAGDAEFIQNYNNFANGAVMVNDSKDTYNPVERAIGNAVSSFENAFKGFEKFFEKILWIFNVSHFLKFMLYIFGFVAIGVGLGMITFGSKVGADSE